MRSRTVLGIALPASAALVIALSVGAAADNNTVVRLRVTSTVGSVALFATSTAPRVQFTTDGRVLDATTVTEGIARATVATWGYPNGTHSASVRDCSTSSCTGRGVSSSYTVANPAPRITSPAVGHSVMGGFTVHATSPGAALHLLLDGRPAGFADGPRYSFQPAGKALSPGKHSLQVLECTSDHSLCTGPASPAVMIRSQAMHPRLSVTPSRLSPNHDGVRDSTSLRFVLDRPELVTLSAVNSHGKTVESHAARSFSKGVHHWRWKGLGRQHTPVPDGTYTLRVRSSAHVNGATVDGSSSIRVHVDTHAPTMRSISGNKSVVYPSRDGYRDTFTPTLTLSEPATLRIVVRDAHRRVIGTGKAAGSKGRTSVTWNGLDRHGHAATPGHYTWTITATDAAGNRSTTSTRAVIASKRHLVKRTVTLNRDGADYINPKVSAHCATTSAARSIYYPRGVLLRTTCSPDADGPQVAAADYVFTLPAATKYGTITLRAIGSSKDHPSQIEASVPRSDTDDITVSGMKKVDSPVRTSYALGTVQANTHLSGRGVDVLLSVDDLYVDSNTAHASSFDVDQVRLTATYYVLR